MSDNGSNDYEVTFGRIMFLEKIIEGHDNIASFIRHSDIVFDVERLKPRDSIQIVCVDEYALSEAMARRISKDFPNVSLVFVGGKWNHSSGEASGYCRNKKIGICNAGSVNSALCKTQYWR